MGRRGATVTVGVLLFALLVWLASTAPVPYVELSPGPTVDTLADAGGKPVITISGAPTTKSEGQLRLTTVNVRDQVTLVEAIGGWLSGSRAVLPRELIYPPDKTEKQIDEDNARQFQASQTSAETAALRKLGYPVQVIVSEVAAGYPAEQVLKVGDIVTAVDGTPVTTAAKLTELVRGKPVGTAREITYTRDGTSHTSSVGTRAGDDGKPRLGISIEIKQPAPFQVDVELERIGGPSAGLMFALGIIDKVEAVDLTGKLRIAGTGTIDDEGNVGPIGGVPQKLRGAKRDRATIFLTPAGNCAEAVDNAVPGLKLVKVGTLDEALSALATLRAGGTPPLCTR